MTKTCDEYKNGQSVIFSGIYDQQLHTTLKQDIKIIPSVRSLSRITPNDTGDTTSMQVITTGVRRLVIQHSQSSLTIEKITADDAHG